MTYVLMALVAALALAVLALPWWRPLARAELRRRAANVAVYRSRLAEIDADIAAGAVDAEAAAQLRTELGARLLAEADAAEAAPATVAAAPARRGLLVALAIALPAFSAAWYYAMGSWRTDGMIRTAARDPQAAQTLAVQSMVQRLAERLEREPDNAEGWAMLGRSYFVLQRHAEAATAYGKANARAQPANPDWLVGEGEALALARDRDLQGRPRELFEQALALAPDQPRALWYAGLAAAQAGDDASTRRHWLRLRQQPDLPPDVAAALDEQLRDIEARIGAPAEAPPAPPAPTAAAGLRLQVQVRLAPELAARAGEGLALFVFAKAENGPPMPLAVQRLASARLPTEVVLDDSMAMMPQLKLSSFERWTVTARLSRGGGAQAQPGDLEGSVSLGRAEADRPVQLTIDRVIPQSP